MSYECGSCNSSFYSQRACNQHMTAKGHHTFKCDLCDSRFRSRRACDQHMSAKGHWIYDHECETCNLRFDSEWACDDHMEYEDHWSYDFDCETCNLAFRSAEARDDHQYSEGHCKDRHCSQCDRYFHSPNNLRAHMNSRIHQGTKVTCPFCQGAFVSASGLSTHVESGGCPEARNLDRATIHRIIRQRDPKGAITERLLGYETSLDADWKPESAWNGRGYECYLCHKVFPRRTPLQQHLSSPTHSAALYHCPNNNGGGGGCGAKKFPSLAALFAHLESESCGYIKFQAVNRNVNQFFANSDRLITLHT